LHLNGFWNSCPDREHAVHKTGRDNAIYFSSASATVFPGNSEPPFI
jgi:hypothetical protein